MSKGLLHSVTPLPGATAGSADNQDGSRAGVDLQLSTEIQPSDDRRARPLVVVADDDPAIRLLVRDALQPWGLDVEEAADGREGLVVIERSNPDLVLCDVMMPLLDGFGMCDAVRHMPGARHLPIVMLTGLDDTESIERAYSVGATEFISKPINWTLLPRRIRYILRASNALRDLRVSEERYALAAQGANDGLWDWDLNADTVYFSPRWKSMLGYEEHEIGDSPSDWLNRVHPDDADRVRAEIAAHLEGETPHLESEHRVRTAERSYRWINSRGLAVRDAQNKAYRMAGSQTDVTERKQAEAQLLFDAFHDTLTGLPNRALFLDRLAHSLQLAARRSEHCCAVLFLDLDRFKVVNDSLGHISGDRLLTEVSHRIQRQLRTGDTLARLGGDEFTVLVEDIGDVTTVTRLAERIQDSLASPIELDGQQIVVTASMGVAVSSSGYTRPEEMLRDADAAMYRAKDAGRACYEIFDSDMHAQARNALEVEADLRIAIELNQFTLQYQPILEISSGQIRGFEALVRWQHPGRGMLLPEEFLTIARETRLIVPIGRWVLHEACRQMQDWKNARSDGETWFVSVNVCGEELAQPDLVNAIDHVLIDTKLPPESLRLEITETSLIKNTQGALHVMNELQARKIQLSIDDFGTGYSSFNYLHRFPFNTLKIDRSFVEDLEKDPHRFEIVKTIINLAHNLGLEVVAEGSETVGVFDSLKSLPCDYVQGYSVSGPRDPSAIPELLAAFERQS